MSQYALSFLGGALSAFSPCVLPTFPLVTGSALQTHKLGPLAVAAGMVASFATLAVSLNATGSFIGLDGTQSKNIAAVLLILFGVLLISSRLSAKTKGFSARIANGASQILQKWTPKGLKGQFMVGALLGAIWMPCAGPALGAAITLAAQGKDLGEAATMMLVFGVGATLPLLAVAYGAKRIFMGKPWLAKAQKSSQLIFGIVLLGFGILALTGGDKLLETGLVNVMPPWLLNITTKY